ncbi:hypothetical protein NLU13_9089 [Sarocladium strictum]|uniref:Uncharacterized protein n=1 Tax=Sarocladium strictum TaxID=5046 RepID=A0AA39L3K0_SARSR|nr:hypothetical protein NLU13_9089 [Sarocladium strictum]
MSKLITILGITCIQAGDSVVSRGTRKSEGAAGLGLHRYVFSSMADATKESKGKFSTLYHMDSKAEAVGYTRTLPFPPQQVLHRSKPPSTFNSHGSGGLPTTPKKV